MPAYMAIMLAQTERTDVISLTNSYLDIITLELTTWEEAKEIPLTDHYFGTAFDLTAVEVATPLWDSIVETHLTLKTNASTWQPLSSMKGPFQIVCCSFLHV